MSNINLIIEERAADIGKFLVGRLLPFRQKRMIGPFTFIDHMGPISLDRRENFDILPHPHIGLSTLTYLFEGSIHHRDSLGSSLIIEPGAVNWMTAGRGIVHSERTPGHLRNADKTLHGLQIWVALPKDLEQMEPSFFHVGADEIPAWERGNAKFKLIAGTLAGRQSPVPVHSPLYLIEIKCEIESTIDLGGALFGETGLYILEGSIESEGEIFGPKKLLLAKEGSLCVFVATAGTALYLFGGEPFPEERYIDWNFVSSDKSIIEKAKVDWENQTFDKIPGDDQEHVPYPPRRI